MSIEGDHKVSVVVRVRPGTRGGANTCTVNSDGTTITCGGHDHHVDGCLAPGTQDQVYQLVGAPLLEAALAGSNGCLLAYGQTASGKTHTMMGGTHHQLDGVMPNFCRALLRHNDKLSATVSFYEIYKERIRDLLADSRGERPKVREHPTVGPYVEGVSGFNLEDGNSLIEIIRRGASQRVSGATQKNKHSSRSHAIMEISIRVNKGEGDEGTLRSKITLVDLAGSERSGTSADGERLAEGLAINRSLLTLGKVISALSSSKKPNHIPYRDSVLTRLLKENLGGNSKTVMLATVSPESDCLDETLSTLRYACRARKITNTIIVNEDPQLRVIRELREEIQSLKTLREDFAGHHSSSEKNIRSHLEKLERDCLNKQMALENLELKRKAAEEHNKIELSRLGMNLKAAEKRQSELESQKATILTKIKNADISYYESGFYDKLQNFLDNTCTSELSFDERTDSLKNFQKSLKKLESSCSYLFDKTVYKRKAQPLLTTIKKAYDELQTLLIETASDSET